MGAVKNILIVDDSFEILAFLRSLLEMADPNYRVLGVPSAEEALLELHRRPYDLLITDMRLPGMNGLDLVRRAQPLRPHMQVIAITAYSSVHNRQEAVALGIRRYFQKPLDPDTFLVAVRAALYEREELHTAIIATPAGKRSKRTIAIYNRLQSLQTDTDAAQVILGAMAGDVLFSSGHLGLDIDQLARLAVSGLTNSLRLADLLGNDSPLVLHYQAGQQTDLYSANVDKGHFLMLFFESGTKDERMSTVWSRVRQAIGELADLLQEHPDLEIAPAEEHDPLLELLDSFLKQEDVDLDAFWESALDEEAGPSHHELSFEEARRRGLLPPGLDFDAEN